MKKIFKSIAVLAVAVGMTSCYSVVMVACMATTLLASCSKDDDDKVAGLKGTAWLWEDEIDGVAVGLEFDFTTDTQVDFNVMIAGVADGSIVIGGLSAGTYRYTYKHPTVTFTGEDGDQFTGRVDGNKLTITEDGETLVFEKED